MMLQYMVRRARYLLGAALCFGVMQYLFMLQQYQLETQNIQADHKRDLASPVHDPIIHIQQSIGERIVYGSRANGLRPSIDAGDQPSATTVINKPPQDIPYKIFIYDLPSKLNADLITCNRKYHCFKTEDGGFGPKWYETSVMSVRNTWQFSLELIMHNKLLHSPYRTMNSTAADVFYVPFYPALGCFCHWSDKESSWNLVKELFAYLNTMPSFRESKPHFLTLSKIEREHASPACGVLRHAQASKLSYIGIEQELREDLRSRLMKSQLPLILAPYPAFGHFHPAIEDNQISQALSSEPRRVFMLIAASARRTNPFRGIIFEQFNISTKSSSQQFIRNNDRSAMENITGVHYITPECTSNVHTLDWMRKSVFCLQPPGDSPTRKSFYDSVISGCIPVIFTHKYNVKYPFRNKLNYKSFTVTLNTQEVEKGRQIYHLLQDIGTEAIKSKQTYLAQVARSLQYSFPITNSTHDDALAYLLDEVKERFHLGQSIK